jgi:prefoldin alpha subunit
MLFFFGSQHVLKMSSAIQQKHLTEKILKYESFLNERLKPDLKSVLAERDQIYNETAEFVALRNTIAAIRSADLPPGQPLKTQVDLGCNFYCRANVEDPSKIFVDIGLGFFLEQTLDEAEKFVGKKISALDEKSKSLTQQASKIKANIRLVLEGLRELQNISSEKAQRSRYDPLA